MTAWTLDDVRRLGRPFVDASAPVAAKSPDLGMGSSRQKSAASGQRAQQHEPDLGRAPKPSKYRNKPTTGPAPWGGNITYPSKRQAIYARRLRDEQSAGNIAGWAIEVSVPVAIEGGRMIRHRMDFAVRHTDGTIEFVEVKGRDLPLGRMKRGAFESQLGPVKVVR